MKKNHIQIVSAKVIPDKLRAFDHEAILYVYRVNGVTIRAIHWSGRFDADVKLLARWLRELAHEHQADYISTTETQQKHASEAIRNAFGPGWGFKKTGEYALVYLRLIFKDMPRLKPHTVVATQIKNWLLWRQMHVGHFNLKHRELKKRFRFLVIHGPSDIQNGSKPKPGKQWDIAATGWPRVGRSLRRFARLHPRAVQIVPADCNANLRDEFWLWRFETWLGARSIWRGRVPSRGSHKGERLIDGVWIYDAD